MGNVCAGTRPCACAEARGRHWVPVCAARRLIHVRQCLSLTLCSLFLARLASPSDLCSPLPQHSWAGAGGNAQLDVCARDPNPMIACLFSKCSCPPTNLRGWKTHPTTSVTGAANAAAFAFEASLALLFSLLLQIP